MPSSGDILEDICARSTLPMPDDFSVNDISSADIRPRTPPIVRARRKKRGSHVL
jgi:hypothetical protein